MRLDPDAAAFLNLYRRSDRQPFEALGVEAARAAYRESARTAQLRPEGALAIGDRSILGPGGDIPVRVYAPSAKGPGPSPGVVFFHGGGWVIGDLNTHDNICRHLALGSGCVVVAVDYRLAPEHRFPAAMDDALAAYAAVCASAETFGIDAGRLAVCGDSAGGGLAAVVAQQAAHRPRAQLLFYPVVDLGAESGSYARLESGPPVSAATLRWFWSHYLGEADGGDVRASPLRAPNLAGAPPTLIAIAGEDPLCDEGRAYAARLDAEGARVTHLHFANQMHGFLTLSRHLRSAGLLLDAACAYLRAEFDSDMQA